MPDGLRAGEQVDDRRFSRPPIHHANPLEPAPSLLQARSGGDGQTITLRSPIDGVVIWEENDVLKVPTSSLFRDGDAWAVYAVTLSTAALTHVEIGQRNGLEAQSVSGLSADAQVIAYPSDTIADGVEVVARQ